MFKPSRVLAPLLGILFFASGCYGPFNLTKRLYLWNGDVGDKWENELVFLLFTILPVYGTVVSADAIIFNSIQFWTGENPVDPPYRKAEAPAVQQKRLARGDEEMRLSFTALPVGARLHIEQYVKGDSAGSWTLEPDGDRMVGRAGDGRVLFSATTLANGSVLVEDAEGQPVGLYSADQVQQFAASSVNP